MGTTPSNENTQVTIPWTEQTNQQILIKRKVRANVSNRFEGGVSPFGAQIPFALWEIILEFLKDDIHINMNLKLTSKWFYNLIWNLKTIFFIRDSPPKKIFTDEIIDTLLSKCTRLRTLSLTTCSNVTDTSLKYLQAHSTLRSLTLSGMPHITPFGFQLLAPLASLTSLTLRNCPQFTDELFQTLASFPHLACLELRVVPITDVGLLLFSSTPVASNVRDFTVQSCTRISSDGIVECVLRMKNLRFLNISYSNITKVGYQTVRELPTLETVIALNCVNLEKNFK
eukprot:TRINITY_DN26768_c0_g1_i1.p1 TRINITY_DN26768_c0_g1~~TRINITY_DN26768_c0_g1_i1.p1  ORF type:complete len:292 (+),score=49.51 TRINITY_DN26768_c0_g1_i1:26-877(+)